MIDASTYKARRDRLRDKLQGGTALFLGHALAPRNYTDNVYPFRQNSHFLYLCGLLRPGLALLVGPKEDILFGRENDLDDVVWHGPRPRLLEEAAGAGLANVQPAEALEGVVRSGDAAALHVLFPYQGDQQIFGSRLLGISIEAFAERSSSLLAEAMYELRARKSPEEIAQIEDALTVTAAMHAASFRHTRPGVLESAVAAASERVALAMGRAQAYNPIVTVRGEVLHNHEHHHQLEDGHLLLNDSGAESPLFYASDITRTAPVSGRFSTEQRKIYDIVLDAQLRSIGKVAPGVPNRDVHLEAALAIAEGLSELGRTRGKPEEAVVAVAHALCFPHGIGHMLGLDVHDMEDLGDVVGYGVGVKRSEQFGLNFLRLARPLEEGFVITIEPGIYFIDALIDRFEAAGTHSRFLNFDRIQQYRGFGGIRIEDDVLCTRTGRRVLGPPIPKSADEVEAAMRG